MTIIDENIPRPENVIQFPVKNPRYDIEGIPTDEEETLSAVKNLKVTFFNKIAEDIASYTSFIIYNNLKFDDETFKEPTIRDLIMLHESVVAILCRMTSIDHALHKIGEDEIEYDGNKDDDFDLDNEDLYYFKRDRLETDIED